MERYNDTLLPLLENIPIILRYYLFPIPKNFLSFQNMGLRQELDRLKNENMLLRDKLSKYTDV